MRRIIRNVESGKYFHEGQWTSDPKLAEHFSDSGKLINACLKHRLTQVEMVLQPNTDLPGTLETRVPLFQ